ncbi:hypothetical protein FisN_6Lh349 [Fistulifera solaris]|uniref:Bromo domain-containing protein n=1 Tax=Fistulifera solaris TaxID=1519565 RepID=A0A1Z5JLC5_FISSO|nr:hypothetical protein FisN_6Lh349 [Fistulifera solaris]|eukprot:GAX14571.1 hypothetical protein FisN_6Lh349 [Fistulifera solaris]
MWNSNNNPNDHRNRHYPPQPPPGYHYRQSPPTYPDPRYPPHHPPYGYGPYWPPPQHQPPHGERPRSGSHGENVYYPEFRHHPGDHAREEDTFVPVAHPEDEEVADVAVSGVAPRGKPEAMAQALAAAKIETKREEIAEMKRKEEERMKYDEDMEEDPVMEVEVEAEPIPEEDEDEAIAEPVVQSSSLIKKPLEAKKKSPSRKKKPKPPLSSSSLEGTGSNLLSRPVDPVSEVEWENLDALMNQFCRVPLLAEFSRPVSLLHPELISTYSKIVKHPLDLGHICRGIRRRQYKNLRDIRLDMWRVFANCVKYHSHPNNKEAVPSFVSIALHLREFFNNLWNEYMLPSDLPDNASTTMKEMFQTRQKDRKSILENSGVLTITLKITGVTSRTIRKFIKDGGRVDALDTDAVFGPDAKEQDRDLEVVVANLTKIREDLMEREDDYALEKFYQDLKAAYTIDVLEENPALRNRIGNRITRMFWKLFLPLHEANTRGVSQSSIWGNIAATIWARESSKKPFWPALCLGILAPEDQRESWHESITQRNEMRLPEKLRAPLEASRNKCTLAQQRQPLSYFMVEFLGTHEFIWVRETDIIENFDASKDPNKDASSSKKKRASRSATSSVIGSKTYATALEECTWAMEEYESVLQDCYNNTSIGDTAQVNEEEDGDDVNYSYAVLAQSDDEADDEDTHGYAYDDATMSLSDVDEANFLLEHTGLLDTSSEGRKNAKKRAQAMKKTSIEKLGDTKSKGRKDFKSKKESKRKDAQRAKEEKTREAQRAKDLDRELRKEEKELEKRRKKRMREREKALRLETRKNKKRRSSLGNEDDDRGLTLDKRARATAIVKAYLTRLAQDDDHKNLGIGGVMNIPAVMIDSTGLLGMALAFRSAAGEIPVPDDGDDSMARLKPWAAVDTESQKTSAERIEALQTKIRLLEAHIKKKRNNIKVRGELTQEAISKRLSMEERIVADDELARRNPYKKKKRYPSPKSTTKSNRSKEANDETEDDEEDEEDDAGSEKLRREDDDNGDDEDDDDKTLESANRSDEDVESAASADIDAMDVENP